MQLGKALVGAIIGAAVGIAVLIAVQHFGQTDKAWLSIVVALLTGLGVRAMVSTSGHPSYLRGALTGVLALAAYCGGTQLFSELATRGILAKKLPAPPPVAAPDVEEGATAEADGVVVPIEPAPAGPTEAAPPIRDVQAPRPALQQFSTWDFVWLSIAALLAYELGRGSTAAAPREPVVPPPDAT